MNYTTHSFDINHAEQFGIREAVLMSHLAFLIRESQADGINFYEGRRWTCNTAKAFADLVPYLSAHQVRRALDKLVDEGVLVKGNFNPHPCDRTLWYAFTDEWAEQVGLAHVADSH